MGEQITDYFPSVLECTNTFFFLWSFCQWPQPGAVSCFDSPDPWVTGEKIPLNYVYLVIEIRCQNEGRRQNIASPHSCFVAWGSSPWILCVAQKSRDLSVPSAPEEHITSPWLPCCIPTLDIQEPSALPAMRKHLCAFILLLHCHPLCSLSNLKCLWLETEHYWCELCG